MPLEWYDRIRDTTASTGTGTLTVSGTAPVNYNTLSARYATNDTFYAVVVNQTAAEWEVSQCTYLGTNNFSRQRVLDGSSGPGSLVNFSAGTKDVAVVLPANFGTRERLTTNRTYYIRTDGNDSNNGLTNTAGGAFLTLQGAWEAFSHTVDTSGFAVTFSVAAGTYTGNLTLADGWTGGGDLTISGAGSTTILSTTSADCISIFATLSGTLVLNNMKLQTTTSGNCINHAGTGIVLLGAGIEFGACARTHVLAYGPGVEINISANYTITGQAANYHISTQFGGFIYAAGVTVTLSGTQAYTAFAYAHGVGLIESTGASYSGGTITGQRYLADLNGIINTASANANFYPGNVAGTTATGGQYT